MASSFPVAPPPPLANGRLPGQGSRKDGFCESNTGLRDQIFEVLGVHVMSMWYLTFVYAWRHL